MANQVQLDSKFHQSAKQQSSDFYSQAYPQVLYFTILEVISIINLELSPFSYKNYKNQYRNFFQNNDNYKTQIYIIIQFPAKLYTDYRL